MTRTMTLLNDENFEKFSFQAIIASNDDSQHFEISCTDF